MKAIYFLIGGLLSLIAVIFLFVFFLLGNAEDTRSLSLQKEGFTLKLDYQENMKWNYSLKGTLPTPCHSAKVVYQKPNMVIKITEPGIAETCVAQIQEVNQTGSFAANSDAEFKTLQVEREFRETSVSTDLETINEGSLEKNGFTLTTEFSANNWNYTITGYKPTPCHTMIVNSVIRESYPEQVEIALTTESKDQICIQLAEEYKYSNTLSASEAARFSFEVVGK